MSSSQTVYKRWMKLPVRKCRANVRNLQSRQSHHKTASPPHRVSFTKRRQDSRDEGAEKGWKEGRKEKDKKKQGNEGRKVLKALLKTYLEEHLKLV